MIEPHEVLYQVDGGAGRYAFQTHRVVAGATVVFQTGRELFAPRTGKEVYRTRWWRRHGLFHGCADLSYRKCLDHLNEVRHQPGATTLRTLCNAAEAEADQVRAIAEARAAELLRQPDYDDRGRPLFAVAAEAPERDRMPETAVREALAACLQAGAPAGLDVTELLANPVPCEAPATLVDIAIDDVGVKKQKRHRHPTADPPPTEGKKNAWTSVAHVARGAAIYCLVADSVPAVLRQVGALLAANELHRHGLLFFIDGQRSLQDAIVDFWARRGRYRLILDWYHLQKKCRELGSLGLKGSIAAKKVHLEALRQLLWYGLVDRAGAYLDALPEDAVRCPEDIERFKGYLERNRPHIPCYALRRQLGLRCSSNRVEKDNDLVVAQRQKRNGMSWSDDGSHALATLTALRQNGELDRWLQHGTLDFALTHAA